MPRRTIAAFLTALLLQTCLLASAAPPDDPSSETRTPSPRQQFNALLKAHRADLQIFFQRQTDAKDKAALQKIRDEEERHPLSDPYMEKFLDLATRYPSDPVAIQALDWVVTREFQTQLGPDIHLKIDQQILARVNNPDLLHVCDMLSARLSPSSRTRLQTIIDHSQNRRVRAYACYCLGTLLNRMAETAESSEERARLERESEPSFTRVIEEYEDVVLSTDERLADYAEHALFELQHLSVGKVAPEIEGTDLNGKPLKLSDFRGRVVMISFWATWCGPCMALVKHEKTLVDEMQDQPFVLLGVNGDNDLAQAHAAVQDNHMTWRSWADGSSGSGPIATRWNVMKWPSVYILDSQGVIRDSYRFRHIRPEVLQQAVQRVLDDHPATRSRK